jgi:hypothetical protein
LPEWLDAAVARALHRDREERFADLHALAAALVPDGEQRIGNGDLDMEAI